MNFIYVNIIASVAIVFCIIIRSIFINKMPKKVFKIIWAIIIVRLIFPKLPSINTIIFQIKSVVPNNYDKEYSKFLFRATHYTQNPHTNQGMNISHLLAIIWITGFLLFAFFFICAYLKNYKMFSQIPDIENELISGWIQNNVHIKRSISIKYSPKMKSPLTYGLIHPVILLPYRSEQLSERQKNYILMHEYIHIKNYDNLFKQIALFAICLNWFNPFCWIMLILLNRDIELACDEEVIKYLGLCNRSDYAMTLIAFEEIKSGLLNVNSNFSKDALEERIVAIMKCKKTNKYIFGTAILCILAVCTFIITDYQVNATGSQKNISTFEDSLNDGIMSKQTSDGDWIISENNGKTWTPESNLETTDSQFEWYTYKEYAAELEATKKELNKMLEDNSVVETSAGKSQLTQKDVDSIIADMEDTLMQIKNGKKISKPQDNMDGMASIPENGISSYYD